MFLHIRERKKQGQRLEEERVLLDGGGSSWAFVVALEAERVWRGSGGEGCCCCCLLAERPEDRVERGGEGSEAIEEREVLRVGNLEGAAAAMTVANDAFVERRRAEARGRLGGGDLSDSTECDASISGSGLLLLPKSTGSQLDSRSSSSTKSSEAGMTVMSNTSLLMSLAGGCHGAQASAPSVPNTSGPNGLVGSRPSKLSLVCRDNLLQLAPRSSSEMSTTGERLSRAMCSSSGCSSSSIPMRSSSSEGKGDGAQSESVKLPGDAPRETEADGEP